VSEGDLATYDTGCDLATESLTSVSRLVKGRSRAWWWPRRVRPGAEAVMPGSVHCLQSSTRWSG